MLTLLAASKRIALALVLLLPLFSTQAQERPEVKVGVYECPPFVIAGDDQTYSGLSILLWEEIAKNLDLKNYSFESYSLQDLLRGVSEGSIDIGVSCISITPERESILDFSHSFYETYSAIAVKKQGYLAFLKNIVTNKKLLTFLLFVCGAACIVGAIYYLLEHNVNTKLYSMSSRSRKMVEGFILGLLFITKGPFNYYEFRTLTGRVLTVFLAVATTLFIASITAVLASSFTVGLLESDIRSPHDLAGKRVGAINASTSSKLLSEHRVIHRTYDNVTDMLDALEAGTIEATLADEAVLRYQIKKAKELGNYQNLTVLPYQFQKQNYGLALEDESPHEELLNRALLQVRNSPEWRQALNRYLAAE